MTTTSPAAPRCINLDWLEVYCLETSVCDSYFFQEKGYEVELRAYGTPMYREMFTIYKDGFKWLEVRRDPYQPRSQGGIFEDGSCHIRLTNRTCYYPDPVRELRVFLLDFGYVYRGITRVDFCLDFLRFDLGQEPQAVIDAYMRREVLKINQANVSAHGLDMWDGRYWNSLKWGSETSMVTTKLYNKTMELSRPGHDKFYIRDYWESLHMCQRQPVRYTYKNKDGSVSERVGYKYVAYGTATRDPIPQEQAEEQQIWRVEFSVKSNGKNWLNLENRQFYRLGLTEIDSRHKQLFLFHSLAAHYFHFKTVTFTRDGVPQRKDRCPDFVVFKTSPAERAFKPTAMPTTQTSVPRWIERIAQDLKKLYNSPHVSSLARAGAFQVMQELWMESRVWNDFTSPEEVYNLKLMKPAELRELYQRLKQLLEPQQQNLTFTAR